MRSCKTRPTGGYALLLVLVFSGVSLTLVAAALRWASNNAALTQRNNLFASNTSVAEVATQKVISRITTDYQTNNESYVYSNLRNYRYLVPAASESPVWAGYQFSDARGNNNQTYIDRLTPWQYGDLTTKYLGLKGYGATYRVISNARNITGQYSNLVSAVRQDIQLASIPLFQYAAFYGVDLEIGAGFNFEIDGPVHCNESIYLHPNRATLTFRSHVTAGKTINLGRKPGNPVSVSQGPVVFEGERDSGVRAVNIPIGVANTSTNLRQLVELPPAGESITSPMGSQRFYNKADLIILISNTTSVAFSGSYNDFAVWIPFTNLFDHTQIITNQVRNNRGRGRGGGGGGGVTYTTNYYDGILSTNQIFFDKRENRNITATEIDIEEFGESMSYFVQMLGRQPRIVYIADYRNNSSTNLCALRLVNGDQLPSGGLTIATPNPVYIRGNYNVDDSELGTSSTDLSKPSAIVADAVTLLSPNWSDANSALSLTSRRASAMTVNTAFIIGTVATGSGYYGGGLENVMRMLEDWNGLRLTFNGSLAVLYPSRFAVAPWGSTGSIYNPPARMFSHDDNFNNVNLLPAGTPFLKTVLKASYAQITPNRIE